MSACPSWDSSEPVLPRLSGPLWTPERIPESNGAKPENFKMDWNTDLVLPRIIEKPLPKSEPVPESAPELKGLRAWKAQQFVLSNFKKA